MNRTRWALILAAAAATLLVWVSWPRHAPHPVPPEVDPSGLDEAVAAALRAATDRVRREPRSAAAWGFLGKLYLAHGFPAEAMACFRRSETLVPDDPAWPYLIGEYMSRVDPAEGIAAFRRALGSAREEADSSLFRVRLAEVLVELGRIDEAEAELVALGSVDGPRIVYLRGVVAAQRGRWPEARTLFGRALAEPRLERNASGQLAAVCRQLGDVTAAARHEARAASLPLPPPWGDPYLHPVKGLQTGMFLRMEQLEGRSADEALDALARLPRPDTPEALLVRLLAGRKLLAAGRRGEAEKVLREGLRHFPAASRLLLRLATIREQDGTKEALEEALALARKAGNGSPARLVAGRALKALGRIPEAAEEFRAAALASPGESAGHLGLGRCLAGMGRKEEAREALTRAVKVAGADPEPARELAAWREKWGEK